MLNMFEEFDERKALRGYFDLKKFLLELDGVEILKTNLLEYSFTFTYKNKTFYSSYYTTLEDKDIFILEDIEEDLEIRETLDSKYILDLLESRY